VKLFASICSERSQHARLLGKRALRAATIRPGTWYLESGT
jgi:hypothetical protein